MAVEVGSICIKLNVYKYNKGFSTIGSQTDQLQTEIAVVAGVLGGVCLILLICVIILTVMLNK